MNDTLGNTFVVEVGDLFAKDEVLEQRRTPQSCFQRVLIVGDRHTLIGRQRLFGRIHAHTIERAAHFVSCR